MSYPYNEYDYGAITKSTRSQIIATGVALLTGYFMNYVCTALIDILGFCTASRPDAGRRLRDHVSRHLYVFGIGCMLSISLAPGLHGIFHTVLAWLAWACLLAMHILYFLPMQDPFGRWKVISKLSFYFICSIWYIGITAYFFKDGMF